MPSCQGLGSAAAAAAASPAMPTSASRSMRPVRAAAPRVIDLPNRTMSLQPLFGEDALPRERTLWAASGVMPGAALRLTNYRAEGSGLRAARPPPPPHPAEAAAAIYRPDPTPKPGKATTRGSLAGR